MKRTMLADGKHWSQIHHRAIHAETITTPTWEYIAPVPFNKDAACKMQRGRPTWQREWTALEPLKSWAQIPALSLTYYVTVSGSLLVLRLPTCKMGLILYQYLLVKVAMNIQCNLSWKHWVWYLAWNDRAANVGYIVSIYHSGWGTW